MCQDRARRTWFIGCAGLGLLLFAAQPSRGNVLEEAQKALDSGDTATAISLMVKEIESNPGFEEAYVVLGHAYEAKDDKKNAEDIWGRLKKITRDEDRRMTARLGLLRTRGPYAPPKEKGASWDDDPFKVDVGRLDWRGLDQLDPKAYINGFPPFWKETKHFVVFANSQQVADFGADLSEKYMAFLMEKFLDGRAWAFRVPVLIYKDHNDYVSVGGNPASSGGVTFSNHLGKSTRVSLFLLGENNQIDRTNLEETLPHELTHVVVNEFFGAQEIPRWLHEALARRMEQTRNHYEEAAKTGRDVVAGEYYRFRDLFDATEYPDGFFRVWRFYEQSATIVLYLLEQGPESMLAFLQALKDQKGHDAAVAAALGIPEDGAVEELEKRWVEWMKQLYVQYLAAEENKDVLKAEALSGETLPGAIDELATSEKIGKWNPVSTDSLDTFKGVGDARKLWKSEGGRIKCEIKDRSTGSALGVRTNDEAPLVLRCKFRATELSAARSALGIAMLDHRGDDTGIQVLTPLDDRMEHQLVCVVTDTITLYVDGKRVGRAPAIRASELDEDIDFPLAFVAYSPVEIWDVETAMIEEFAARTADATSNGAP